MRILPLAFLAVIAAPAAEAQPYSISMAQCAALTKNAARWVTSAEANVRLMSATRLWQRAAIARAQAEGVQNAEARIADVMARQSEEWEVGGAAFFYTQEFRDWSAYCREFAKAQKIDLNP